ncbi:phospholipase D-like domain-containing protein [Mesorhizobium sp. M1406]|uniref:phospholipase D-like domain-containing protein n=1 Tax=Mesorhizobium sp. M1406 TaxID=2957099 RepID=UPI00333D54B6
MRYVYLPLYRMAVSYLYSFGRRWSIIEHMLLIETSLSKRTALELAESASLPHRLVVEALINLLRANWVEVRSDSGNVHFAATPAGKRRATEKTLPERLLKDVRWDSVCVDRMTGHWMRADDLDLVYERDLPDDCEALVPLLHTFEPNDGALRDLFRLNLNESLEPSNPQFRTPSLPYARIGIAFNEVQTGLPAHVPLALTQALVSASQQVPEADDASDSEKSQSQVEGPRDHLTMDDLIIGGPAHRRLLREILENAKTAVVIHSCFLGAETLQELVPDLERAARRKIRIELLWGLYTDPEGTEPVKKLSDAIAVLEKLPAGARSRVKLSSHSSGSHAKVIVYDDRETGKWTSVVGSSNFLSSEFDWMEVSIRTRSALLSSQIMSRLLSSQLPAVGNWTGTARRLSGLWSLVKQQARTRQETGAYALSLVSDHDHYACVTLARDEARRDIEIACDLYGLSAETSVLVPMESAAAQGVQVRLAYTRPSKFLLAEGRQPTASEIGGRGITLERLNKVHAKYLAWDDDNLVVTSFNWMATALDSRRSRGAELGVLIQGPDICKMLATKLRTFEFAHHFESIVPEDATPS